MVWRDGGTRGASERGFVLPAAGLGSGSHVRGPSVEALSPGDGGDEPALPITHSLPTLSHCSDQPDSPLRALKCLTTFQTGLRSSIDRGPTAEEHVFSHLHADPFMRVTRPQS